MQETIAQILTGFGDQAQPVHLWLWTAEDMALSTQQRLHIGQGGAEALLSLKWQQLGKDSWTLWQAQSLKERYSPKHPVFRVLPVITPAV